MRTLLLVLYLNFFPPGPLMLFPLFFESMPMLALALMTLLGLLLTRLTTSILSIILVSPNSSKPPFQQSNWQQLCYQYPYRLPRRFIYRFLCSYRHLCSFRPGIFRKFHTIIFGSRPQPPYSVKSIHGLSAFHSVVPISLH